MLRSAVPALVAAAVLGAVPRVAAASDGWQKVPWAATEEQVKSAYPEATLMNDADQRRRSVGGMRCKFRMPYEQGDRAFETRFCFDSTGKLGLVTLSQTSAVRPGTLLNDLTSRYGKPEDTDTSEDMLHVFRWRDGNTLVHLILFRKPVIDTRRGSATYTETGADVQYRAASNSGNRGL